MFGHGVFDAPITSQVFRNEDDDPYTSMDSYTCYKEEATPPVKECYEKVKYRTDCYMTPEAYNECFCKCNDNPLWHESVGQSGEYTGSTEMPDLVGSGAGVSDNGEESEGNGEKEESLIINGGQNQDTPQENKPLFCWKCPAGYILGGLGILAGGYIYFMIKNPGYWVAGQAIGAGGNVLSSMFRR